MIFFYVGHKPLYIIDFLHKNEFCLNTEYSSNKTAGDNRDFFASIEPYKANVLSHGAQPRCSATVLSYS